MAMSMYTSTVCHDQCKHCTAVSRIRPLLHHVFDASATIDIGSSVLAAIYTWIQLTSFLFD